MIRHPEAAGRKIPAVERRAAFIYERISAVIWSMYSYARDSSSLCSAHSSRRSRRVALTGFLPLSHASRRAAAGRYSLRLAMPVRALRALPVTARSGTYLPASLLGALLSPPQTRSLSALVGIVVARRPKGLPSTPFLLRKTVPFSRPRRQSQFCPPAAVACLPPPGHARTPCVER